MNSPALASRMSPSLEYLERCADRTGYHVTELEKVVAACAEIEHAQPTKRATPQRLARRTQPQESAAAHDSQPSATRSRSSTRTGGPR